MALDKARTSTSGLTPFSENAAAPSKPKTSMPPGLLAYRLRCLSDELSRLAHAVPNADEETWSELLRARDAIWFAAKRIQPQQKGTR